MNQEKLSFDVVIVGAGVLGCACANSFSNAGFSTLVLESNTRIGEGVSSRNSGVIHAGIYYPPNSLKAKLCIQGNRMLYDWTAKHRVPAKKMGKLIVAQNSEEVVALEALYKNALDSGASGISLLTARETSLREKEVKALASIYSTETGIIDAYELCRSLKIAAEAQNAYYSLDNKLIAAEQHGSGFVLNTGQFEVNCKIVINAAGLYSDEVARLIGITNYKIYPCRGDYFKLKTHKTYSHLIYPVKIPNAPGLGVHLTMDLGGCYRLGPDAYYCDSKNDFKEAPNKLENFHQAAQKLLGDIEMGQLTYDTCGIRPKIRSPLDKSEKDFIINEDLPGWVNLIGMESPGLTASLAISEFCLKLISRN